MQQQSIMERVQALEKEKSNLVVEFENLQKAAETRITSLKGEIGQMRQDIRNMRELLAPDKQAEIIVKSSNTQPTSSAGYNPVTPVVPNTPVETQTHDISEAKISTPPSKSDLDFTDDERKILKLLEAHGGAIPRKNLRREAGMRWYEASHVVLILAKRGVIAFKKEKDGDYILLVNQPKQQIIRT